MAIVIIAIAFVALSYAQILNIRVTADSSRASTATQVANEYLEVLVQRILADYSAYQTCPTGEHCSGSNVEVDSFFVDYSIARGETYQFEGLVFIDLRVHGPAEARLQHFVSCMDTEPPPTVAHPGICE